MRGHCHDGTRAVTHQDVVGDPDRDLFFVHGIDGVGSRKNAGLLFCQLGALKVALASGLFAIQFHCGHLLFADQFIDQTMLWCQHHVGGAEECIWTGGEDGDGFVNAIDFELHLGTFAAADPVALQEADAFWPVQTV